MGLGCQSDDDPTTLIPELPPVPFATVNADTTDLLPLYALESDQRLYGELFFEAGYFVNTDRYEFTLSPNFFMAHYDGDPIRQSKIDSDLMCASGYDDCGADHWPAAIWDMYGTLPDTDTLRWEYIRMEEDQGFRLEMTNLPQAMQSIQVPLVLTADADQVITYEKASDQDSLALELVVIPKTELTRQHDLPSVNHTRIYFAKLQYEEGKVTVLHEELEHMKEFGWFPTEEDTVFWNVASLRKVIKVVDGKNMQLAYQRNHLVPVDIE